MRLWTAVVLSSFALSFGGCATTKPWQRERLASPLMDLDRSPSKLRQHYLSTREGAVGGFGGGGGGCGCN